MNQQTLQDACSLTCWTAIFDSGDWANCISCCQPFCAAGVQVQNCHCPVPNPPLPSTPPLPGTTAILLGGATLVGYLVHRWRSSRTVSGESKGKNAEGDEDKGKKL